MKDMELGIPVISLCILHVFPRDHNPFTIMHLSMVCPRMGVDWVPQESVFKMLHQGRDFCIDNNPLFVLHFEKLSRTH